MKFDENFIHGDDIMKIFESHDERWNVAVVLRIRCKFARIFFFDPGWLTEVTEYYMKYRRYIDVAGEKDWKTSTCRQVGMKILWPRRCFVRPWTRRANDVNAGNYKNSQYIQNAAGDFFSTLYLHMNFPRLVLFSRWISFIFCSFLARDTFLRMK